jgi:hypothetical protein
LCIFKLAEKCLFLVGGRMGCAAGGKRARRSAKLAVPVDRTKQRPVVAAHPVAQVRRR